MKRFEYLYRQPQRLSVADSTDCGRRFAYCEERVRSFNSSRRDMERMYDHIREGRS